MNSMVEIALSRRNFSATEFMPLVANLSNEIVKKMRDAVALRYFPSKGVEVIDRTCNKFSSFTNFSIKWKLGDSEILLQIESCQLLAR